MAAIISFVWYSHYALLYAIILKRAPTEASVKGTNRVTESRMRGNGGGVPFSICYEGEGLRRKDIGCEGGEIRRQPLA